MHGNSVGNGGGEEWLGFLGGGRRFQEKEYKALFNPSSNSFFFFSLLESKQKSDFSFVLMSFSKQRWTELINSAPGWLTRINVFSQVFCQRMYKILFPLCLLP